MTAVIVFRTGADNVGSDYLDCMRKRDGDLRIAEEGEGFGPDPQRANGQRVTQQ